jgi:signal transduction histidine kinase
MVRMTMRRGFVPRLMLGYTAVIVCLLLAVWWEQGSLAEVERVAQRLSERSVQGIELSAKLEHLLEDKGHIAEYLVSHDPDALRATTPPGEQLQEWLAAMADFVRTDEERALLDRLRDRYAAYRKQVDETVSLVRDGRDTEARAAFRRMAASVEQLLADGEHLSALAEDDMRERRAQVAATIEQGRSALLWLTGLGAFLSLAIGFALSRLAARPISRLVLRLGSSGVVDQVEVDGDELGVLEARVGALLDRVRRQERALQQAEKLSEIGEIASQVAHETLNPLAGVKGMLQALRRTTVPPTRLSAELSDMERELARVEGIVQRLMRYARPLEPRMRSVAVQEVLADAARVAGRAPGAQGRAIVVDAPSDGVAWVLDPELILQVLVNLLVNACEASSPGSTVRLCAAVDAGQLVLEVHDRGVGVATADRERLFHPFFTTKPAGNGLGLAVSRNIVREHGGVITARPADGGGSVFAVLLPNGEVA